jgi:ATP-dependent DNA helicase RecG
VATPAPQLTTEQRPVAELRGVGPALAEKLARLGVVQVQDLLFVLPSRYEDRTQISSIGELRAGARAVVEGEIQLTEVAYRRRRQLLCRITDGTGSLTLRFFYFSGAQQANLARGARIRCFGEVRRGPLGLEIVHPEYRRTGPEQAPLEEVLTPIYPTTEGVPQARLRSLIELALKEAERSGVRDWIPPAMLADLALPSLVDALTMMHRPPRDAHLPELLSGHHPAQRRLAFEELLAHQLSLRLCRTRRWNSACCGRCLSSSPARSAVRSPRWTATFRPAGPWCAWCRVTWVAARRWWPRPPPRAPWARACRPH